MNANIPDAEQALQMYKSMWRIRRFEQRFLELRDQTVARGGVAVAIGQEAVAVGVCATLRTNDYITSTHRGDGHCLAKGADPGRLMAEFLGRREGYCGNGGTRGGRSDAGPAGWGRPAHGSTGLPCLAT